MHLGYFDEARICLEDINLVYKKHFMVENSIILLRHV